MNSSSAKCSSPSSDFSSTPSNPDQFFYFKPTLTTPERFIITLKVLGDLKSYDIRYLYTSILNNKIDPFTGVEFSDYQIRRIKLEYHNRIGIFSSPRAPAAEK